MGEQYPLKAVSHTKKERKKEVEEEENYSLQTEPTWEHKALSGTDSIFFFFHFFLVCETVFKGYCLPTSCKKHTGTGASSPKRAHCSGVVRSSFLLLQARFHYLSLQRIAKFSLSALAASLY